MTGATAQATPIVRLLDPSEMLDRPPVPVPFRCDPYVADGYVTVLAGVGGEGKSWLAAAWAVGVVNGTTVGGMACAQGHGLILDAENGEQLIASRYRMLGGPRTGLTVYEVESLNLANPAHIAWIADRIHEHKARYVVLDSLRSLAPTMEENNGDTVAPVMANLRKLARRTGAAIVVVHHRPKNGQAYRGSSVLRDQADILAVLGRHEGDPEGTRRRYLHADGTHGGKMRIAVEPPRTWLYLDTHDGRVSITHAEPPTGDQRPATITDGLADRIADYLAEHPGERPSTVARAVGYDPAHGTVRRAVQRLVDEGRAERRDALLYPAGLAAVADGNGNGKNDQLPLATSPVGGWHGNGNGKSPATPANALTADVEDCSP